MHLKGKKMTDFNEIRSEIQNETDRVAGTEKNISNIPITLRLSSPNFLTLTLIDLPGITRVPIGGQAEDIEKQIKNMILKFIQKKNCLILAVIPATSDLGKSDGLKLAQKVDKNGLRTIGVVTKLDLMPAGTDALDILENKVVPLKRGYVGVVNRSQDDINKNKDMGAALDAEDDFFKNHKHYGHIANRMGTRHLLLVLNQELGRHIQDHLPTFQDKLQREIVSLQKETKSIKELYPEDELAMLKMLHTIINQLKKDFDKEIGSLGAEPETRRLTCGSKINDVFYER